MSISEFACVFARPPRERLAVAAQLVASVPSFLGGAEGELDLYHCARTGYTAAVARTTTAALTRDVQARLAFWSARAGARAFVVDRLEPEDRDRFIAELGLCERAVTGTALGQARDLAVRFFRAIGVAAPASAAGGRPVLALDLDGPGAEGLAYQAEARALFLAGVLAPPRGDAVALSVRQKSAAGPVEGWATVAEVRGREAAKPGQPAGFTLRIEGPAALHELLAGHAHAQPGHEVRTAPRFHVNAPVKVTPAPPPLPSPPPRRAEEPTIPEPDVALEELEAAVAASGEAGAVAASGGAATAPVPGGAGPAAAPGGAGAAEAPGAAGAAVSGGAGAAAASGGAGAAAVPEAGSAAAPEGAPGVAPSAGQVSGPAPRPGTARAPESGTPPAPSPTTAPRARVEYATEQELAADWVENLSHGGAFVRTASPQAEGTELAFELALPDGARLDARAVVAFVNAKGMGLRFVLSPEQDQVLAAAIARICARPKRALVVDDDALARQMFADALVARGFEVLTASDGQQGIQVLMDELLALDLFVTDVVMPGLSGEELIRMIREAGGEAELAIVAMSGRLDPGVERSLEAAGADAVLDKALGAELVAQAADAVLERKRLVRQADAA